MQVGITIDIDKSLMPSYPALVGIAESLKDWFADKTYGGGIDHLHIGIVLAVPRSGRSRPGTSIKYSKTETFLNRFSGELEEFSNVVEYEIRPDVDRFRGLNVVEARKYVAELMVESVGELARCRDRYPSFDIPAFQGDLCACLLGSAHMPK